MRWLFVNFIMLFVLLFFTTPSILIDTLSTWSHNIHIDDIYAVNSLLNSILIQFKPIFLYFFKRK
jgi:hypothetical protein